MTYCTKCGAQLAPDALFCARCGTPVPGATPPAAETPVAAPPPAAVAPPAPTVSTPTRSTPSAAPTHAPAHPPARSTWWIIPVIIVGLIVIAWLLLAGLPFGRSEEASRNDAPAPSTIAEGTAAPDAVPPFSGASSGTLIEVPGEDIPTTTTLAPPVPTRTATSAPPATTTARPPATATTRPPVTATTRPPVTATQPPVTVTQPPPVRTQPRPTPPPPATATTSPPRQASREISDAEAAATLRPVAAGFYDDVSGNCLEIRSHGYQNVGYTFSVWDACVQGGGSRRLGRWRVDSKTREVFRQREDGRYLRP